MERIIGLKLGSERSLPLLVKGVPAHSVKLEPNDDGTYTLTVVSRIGDTRAENRLPAADFFVQAFNEFLDELDGLGHAVSPSVDAALDRFKEKWQAYNGGGTNTPADAPPIRPEDPTATH